MFDRHSLRAGPVKVHVDAAVSGCKLRIGLELNGERAVHRATLPIRCRGLAQRKAQRESGSVWRWHQWEKWLSLDEAKRDLSRVFTDGPNLLVEGYEVLGRCESRPRPLAQLLGTGAALDLIPNPYNIQDEGRYCLARGVVDFGLVVSFSKQHPWPGRLRLELFRPLLPRDGHFVLLWSNRHGLHRIAWDAVRAEDEGRVWSFVPPWTDEPEALLAAVGYDRYRLGFGWTGQLHRFFIANHSDHPGLTARQRLALVRWFRLPGLLENQRGEPNLQESAHAHPADLLAVAVFDRGLDQLPGDAELYFERTPHSRQAFEAIVRQLLLDCPLSEAQAEAIDKLFAELASSDPCGLLVERLFPSHPVLSARVVCRVSARHIPAAERSRSREWLRAQRYRLAGFAKKPSCSTYQARLEQLRNAAAKTFSENNWQPTDEYFIQDGIVNPAQEFALSDVPLDQLNRHNLLIALGSGDFRLYLALCLLEGLEGRI